ncbi:hypothetical protein [Oryza sativa Japonica Group]|uniref:Uncharacterized protein n=1 Tax=Oryza sativa subsp. japonica TaxID=39947 RepID=Q5N7X0_ORYSJ|nr:hypothetical protein [Oryza sativa Japonica Group]
MPQLVTNELVGGKGQDSMFRIALGSELVKLHRNSERQRGGEDQASDCVFCITGEGEMGGLEEQRHVLWGKANDGKETSVSTAAPSCSCRVGGVGDDHPRLGGSGMPARGK